MIPLIAPALLGAWTYAGFLDEPSPPPTPPAVIVVPDTPDPSPGAPDAEDSATPPPIATAAVAAAPPKAPTLYRLGDARGQIWEHPDPGYLRAWVENRNRFPFVNPR